MDSKVEFEINLSELKETCDSLRNIIWIAGESASTEELKNLNFDLVDDLLAILENAL